METGRGIGRINVRSNDGARDGGTELLQWRSDADWSANKEGCYRYEAAAGVTNRICRVVAIALIGRHLHFGMVGMFNVLGGVVSNRLMMRVRRMFLSKGRHRAVRQAREAEQHGNDGPEA